jgi:SAM-dependent methyltransferase
MFAAMFATNHPKMPDTLGGGYFVPRRARGPYEGRYWGVVRDPDGQLRDRGSEIERLNYLQDVAAELAFVNELQPGCILDYGAGLGWFLQSLPIAWAKTAAEIDEDAVRALLAAGIHTVRDLNELGPREFDVVVAHHVIEHLPNPINAIQHIRRVLVPNGWLILGTPDFASPCALRFGERYRMLHDKTHCSLFTLESLHRFVRAFGFTIERLAFPFPERYATAETMQRWNDTESVSPPWPGNWVTLYCRKI